MVLNTAIVCILVIIDQLTKTWALELINLEGRTYPLWQGVFHLTYVENTGASFGILADLRWFLVTVTAAACVALIWYIIKKNPKPAMFRFPLLLILAGAIGNLVDRVFQGYVVDFLDFRLINFAVFNFADCCVVVGTILLCVYVLFFAEKEKKKLAAQEAETENEPESDNGESYEE